MAKMAGGALLRMDGMSRQPASAPPDVGPTNYHRGDGSTGLVLDHEVKASLERWPVAGVMVSYLAGMAAGDENHLACFDYHRWRRICLGPLHPHLTRGFASILLEADRLARELLPQLRQGLP